MYATYSCDPILSYRSHQIWSKEGFQQGDPLNALEFCETVQPLLLSLDSDVSLGFMDDFTLSGHVDIVAFDVEKIVSVASETGLLLNPTKCEVISFDDTITNKTIFKEFIHTKPADMTLLGAPVLKGSAIDRALTAKIDDLTRVIDWLSLLYAHDALSLLRNCFSKLLYTLRTSPCSDDPLLTLWTHGRRSTDFAQTPYAAGSLLTDGTVYERSGW